MKRKQIRILQQFRLPKDLYRWLAEQSDKTGKTKTRLVEEALRAKIGLKEAA